MDRNQIRVNTQNIFELQRMFKKPLAEFRQQEEREKRAVADVQAEAAALLQAEQHEAVAKGIADEAQAKLDAASAHKEELTEKPKSRRAKG